MALIGAIIGDIIGSRFEFPDQRPENLDYQNVNLISPFCEYTDDTVMAIATKFAIDKYYGIESGFAKAYREFGLMFPDVGYGDKFFEWINNPNAKAYESYGNGSAMRIPYIADFFIKKNITLDIAGLKAISDYAVASAKCTHNSLEGELGAMTAAISMTMCGNKLDKDKILKFFINAYKGHIYNGSEPLEYLRMTYTWSDTCDKTVPVAFRCFYESTDYESCIRNCLSLPCDMDTVCCIAGAMAEAYYGTTGLDNKSILKTYLPPYLYKYIEDIVEKEEKVNAYK